MKKILLSIISILLAIYILIGNFAFINFILDIETLSNDSISYILQLLIVGAILFGCALLEVKIVRLIKKNKNNFNSKTYILNNEDEKIKKVNNKPLTDDDFINHMKTNYYNSLKKIDKADGNCFIEISSENICPRCGKPRSEYMAICEDCYKNPYNNNYSSEYNDFLKKCATILILKLFLKPNQYSNKNDRFPVYFKYKYYIKVENLISEMYNNNLLRNINLKEFLTLFSASDLKKILIENNIKPLRKKEDLINQIIEYNIKSNQFNEMENYYITSNEGKNEYDKNYEYILVHRYLNDEFLKKYFELRKKYKNDDGYSFADIYYMLVKDNINYNSSLNLMNLYYNDNNYKKAIIYCLRVIIFNCCDSVCCVAIDNQDFNELILREKESNIISNKIIQQLKDMKEFYHSNILKEQFNYINLPFKLCSIEFIENFINTIFNDNTDNIKIVQFSIKQEKIKNLKLLKNKIFEKNKIVNKIVFK